LNQVSHGLELYDYEVPFTYEEHRGIKTELVKLRRLCLRCAPLLFQKKKDQAKQLHARKSREILNLVENRQQRSELKDHNQKSWFGIIVLYLLFELKNMYTILIINKEQFSSQPRARRRRRENQLKR